MKRIGQLLLAMIFALSVPVDVLALTTTPSDGATVKTAGPFLITEYSFSGHSLRYVQVYNNSDDVATLDGWKIVANVGATKFDYAALAGIVAPGKYATIANQTVLPSATFTYSDTVASTDPIFSSITLQAPTNGPYLNEAATVSVTTSTVRVAGTPATFYFARARSTTTGSYLSSFAAFVPSASPQEHVILSDPLYVPPSSTPLKIVEIFPDAPACAPFDPAFTCKDYVKLQNTSASTINLEKYRLRTGAYGQAASASNTAMLVGEVGPHEFAVAALPLSASGSWVWLEDTYGLKRYDSSLINYPSSSDNDGEAWSYNPAENTWQWTPYATPANQANQFPAPVVINQCQGISLSEIAANVPTEDQFIELINRTGSPVDMTGCVLQTNRSTTNSYAFPNSTLAAHAHASIYIKDTSLTLTKTTTGTVYLLSSDKQTETDAVEYRELAEDSSWASINNEWRQTYALTPNAGNVWQAYLPCDDGYVRNAATGRCNKVETATTLAACGAGKYRSNETNRCRNLATASSSLLAPCASNQVRNPLTNRCRLNTTQASSLKPCTATQERNAVTNRCRNKVLATTADFPVEAIARTGQATLGWWAFGGVTVLAAGYAGWEWRREMLGAIKKYATFFSGK